MFGITPWGPSSLLNDWERWRRTGPLGFVVRFGLLRIAPWLAAPIVGMMILSGVSVSLVRWIALGSTYLVIGLIWGALTWRTCESRWTLSRGNDEPPG
jgi:hypothetical protein